MIPDRTESRWQPDPEHGGLADALAIGGREKSVRCWPFTNYQWNNNVIDTADLRNASDWTWWDSSLRNIYCVASGVRAYQIWSGCKFTGTTTNGSATVTGISSTTGMVVGQAVTGVGIPAGSVIGTIASSTSITLVTWTQSTLGGTLTNGSPTVSGITTAGMQVGNSITGTGIPNSPVGTTISVINNSSTLTLSANATQGGATSLTTNISAASNATANGTVTLGYNSPYVYTQNNTYPGSRTTSGSVPATAAWGSGTPPPYFWTPPGNSSANSVEWMGKGSGNNEAGFSAEIRAPSRMG